MSPDELAVIDRHSRALEAHAAALRAHASAMRKPRRRRFEGYVALPEAAEREPASAHPQGAPA